VWVSTGHAEPPLAADVMMPRVRDWTPPPHLAEHAPHAPHSDTTQFCGQGTADMQTCDWVRGGHGRPLNSAGEMMARVRVCVPPVVVAQLDEQGPQLDHVVTTQSMGHAAVLHDWMRNVSKHG